MFELARVAEKATNINNKSPSKEPLNSSSNRADLTSLGDITLNFFGKDDSAKTIKLVFQNYKIRTYSKPKNIAAVVTLSLLCVVCLIGIIVQYPESGEGRSNYVAGVMISLLSGMFMWSVLKIIITSCVLHKCKR